MRIPFYSYFTEGFLVFIRNECLVSVHFLLHLASLNTLTIIRFYSVNIVSYIDFLDIRAILNFWHKPHFVMVYFAFSILLDLTCWNFVRDLCAYFVFVVFLWCLWFLYEGDIGLTNNVPSSYYLKEFVWYYYFFLKCVMEFTSEAISNYSFLCGKVLNSKFSFL